MSEYMKDSGHRTMRTCDGCGGAFFCGDVEGWDEGEDDSAPDWTCDHCEEQAQTIKALADALDGTAPRKGPHLGPCWCTHVDFIPPREDLHGSLCVARRAALRLAGRL